MMNIFLDSAVSNRYDKSISLFSPDGDLLQIKYADKAGANGLSLVCIITAANSIVLCSPALPSHNLMDRRCVDKVSKVDEGIWVAFAGLLGDGRYITRKARQFCNSYQMKFGCRPDVAALAHHIGSLQHEASVKGGKMRPHALVSFFKTDFRKHHQLSSSQFFRIKTTGTACALYGI
jgi:20S proteasome alpha/beta subunit